MPITEIHSRRYLRQIIAEEKGLRWQEKPAGEWHTAGWNEIEYFYTEPHDEQGRFSSYRDIVLFRDGRKLIFDERWSNYDLLCRRITNRSAHKAGYYPIAGQTDWIPVGTGIVKLPASFAYSHVGIRKRISASNRTLLSFVIFLAVILAALIGASTLPYFLFQLLVRLVGALVFFTAWGWFPSVLNAWYRQPRPKQIRDAEQRAERGERFEVTRETLTLWRDGEKQVVPWSDVIGYDEPTFTKLLGKDTVRIRTAGGKEFSFTSLMEGAEDFAPMLPLLAQNAVSYRRGQNEQAALGGMRLRWTGGEEGKGDRVFHRRTRKNLLSLAQYWFGPAFMLYWFGPGFAKAFLSQWSEDPGYFTQLSGIAFILLILLLLGGFAVSLRGALQQTRSYLRDRVVPGKEGIQVVKAGEEQALRWDAIANARIEAEHVSLEGRDGTALEFTPSEYAYGNELPDLIQEHRERTAAEAARVAVTPDVAQPKPETRVWTEREPQAEQQQLMRRIH